MDLYERYPKLVIGVGILVLGGEAGFLLGSSPASPDNVPRLLLGWAIALVIVVVPTALMRIGAVRRVAAYTLAAIIAAAALIGAALAATPLVAAVAEWQRTELHWTTAPVDVAFPTELGVIVLWGACVLVVKLGRLFKMENGETGHRGHVQALGPRRGYQARCVCGWTGPVRPYDAPAFADAGDHASPVDFNIHPAEPAPRHIRPAIPGVEEPRNSL